MCICIDNAKRRDATRRDATRRAWGESGRGGTGRGGRVDDERRGGRSRCVVVVVCPTDLARSGAFPPEVRHEFRLRLLVLLDVQLLERFHDRAMAARDAVVHCRGGDRVEVRPELRDDLLVRLALQRRDAALVPDHSGDMHLTRSPRVHGTSGGDVGCRRRVKVNAPGIHTHTHTRV